MKRFEIVPFAPHFVPQAAWIERACFSLPWSERMLMDELENAHGVYLAATRGDVLLGYAGAQIILDEGYITNIATHPEHRRQGVADALLKELLRTAEGRGARFLTLEVRRLNRAAQLLYEKNGFTVAGVRPNYYEKPKEDALLYTRFFGEVEESYV